MTNSQKTYSLTVIGIIVIVGLLVWGTQKKSDELSQQDPIRIGAILPLSGGTAYYGEQGKRGIELAKTELQQADAMPFEIFYEDSLYTPKGGLDAYQALKNKHQPDAVISLATSVSMALQPILQQDGILQMAIASSAPTYSSPNDLSFRTIPIITFQADELAKLIQQRQYQRIGALYLNNDFGKGAWVELKGRLQQTQPSITITSEENFLLEATDFRTQLTKIKAANPDVVFIVGTAAHYVDILRQMKAIGLQTQVLSISSTEDPILLRNAAAEAEGLIYTYYPLDTTNPDTQRFMTQYQEKYGELPDGYAAEGYEAVRLINQAFGKCQRDYDCIQEHLINLTGYTSVFGQIDFDDNGDIMYPFILKTVKNGQFIPL